MIDVFNLNLPGNTGYVCDMGIGWVCEVEEDIVNVKQFSLSSFPEHMPLNRSKNTKLCQLPLHNSSNFPGFPLYQWEIKVSRLLFHKMFIFHEE